MNNCTDHKLNVNVPAGIVRGAVPLPSCGWWVAESSPMELLL